MSGNINLGVFFLPIGLGILMGSGKSRWWARFFIILGYIFCAVVSALVIIYPQYAHVNWFGHSIRGVEATTHAIIAMLLFVAFLIAQHKLLYSTKSNAFFDSKKKRNPTKETPTEPPVSEDKPQEFERNADIYR
ncbi:hypothetical protein P4E94_19215 [Pontiellaceae bacterium B12219]|nr:hypothetical protein [Pontiellaceae bacterium B12219]